MDSITSDVPSVKTEPVCVDSGDSTEFKEVEDNIEITIENSDNFYPNTIAGKLKSSIKVSCA